VGDAGPQLLGPFDMLYIWRQRALKMPAQRLRGVLIIDEGSDNMHGKNILRKVQLNLDKAGRGGERRQAVGAKLWVPSCGCQAVWPQPRQREMMARLLGKKGTCPGQLAHAVFELGKGFVSSLGDEKAIIDTICSQDSW
jgi:hypothetical protein